MKLIQQQLFKKNTYQFWLAVDEPDSEVFLNLYDDKGKLVETKAVKYPAGKHVVSLVITPSATGVYYLRLALSEQTKSTRDWAVIYAYK